MDALKIKILNDSGETLTETDFSENTVLVYNAEYKEGDIISIETKTAKESVFCEIRLDDTILPSVVCIKGKGLEFKVPFGEKKLSYSQKSFSGKMHVITAKISDDSTVHTRRNLAINPYDTSTGVGIFPHASANIETRGESVFAARNVIDGIYANNSHGEYPYQSWGINRRTDAELKVEFGKTVEIDEVRITLRADFPHDSYWTEGKVEFSDGSTEILNFYKTHLPQIFPISKKTTEYMILKELIKAEDESPFPALTQIEAWGCYKR